MPKVTKVSKEGARFIKNWEGCRLFPYLCPAGVPTIAYGNTHYPSGKRVSMSDPKIDQITAEKLFTMTIPQYEKYVDQYTRDDITQSQFDALVSIFWNCGPGDLSRSTLLKLINANPKDPKIKTQWIRWNKSPGTKDPEKRKQVEAGLLKRRQQELAMYFGGK